MPNYENLTTTPTDDLVMELDSLRSRLRFYDAAEHPQYGLETAAREKTRQNLRAVMSELTRRKLEAQKAVEKFTEVEAPVTQEGCLEFINSFKMLVLEFKVRFPGKPFQIDMPILELIIKIMERENAAWNNMAGQLERAELEIKRLKIN